MLHDASSYFAFLVPIEIFETTDHHKELSLKGWGANIDKITTIETHARPSQFNWKLKTA